MEQNFWLTLLTGAMAASMIFFLLAAFYIRSARAFAVALSMAGFTVLGVGICLVGGLDPSTQGVARFIIGIPLIFCGSGMGFLGMIIKEKDVTFGTRSEGEKNDQTGP